VTLCDSLCVQFADKCASLARTTALLYCFTPASIFHLAPGYTEAMFTFLATYGALSFARGSMYSHKLVRSNGVLLGIFPACEIAVLLFAVKRERKYFLSQRLTALPLHVVGGLCIALPTVLVQHDAYKKFCGPDSRYEKARRPWCAKFPIVLELGDY
jgi:Gpi18-like mannosyltransferase